MAFNPYASPQAQDASRMPQTGFGQSNLSPQYGGVPNQNAFQNANPAANLYSRFGAPSEGASLTPSGGAPASSQASPMGVPFGGRPTPENYGGPMFTSQQPYGRPQGFAPFGVFGRFGGPNQMAMQNANPYADLMARFGGGQMNYLPIMAGYGFHQAPQAYPQFNALLGPR